MASPQVEEGYTRIANTLYEAICRHPFSGRELKIVLAVIRYTYGFGRKKHPMSLKFISKATGIDRSHVSRTERRLVASKVLLKEQHENGEVIGINKNFDSWLVLPKEQRIAERATGCVAETANLPVAERAPKKERTTKERTTKKGARAALPDPPAWLDTETWNGWLADRKERGKPVTARAARQQLKALEDWKAEGQDPLAIINQSITNGYLGFFPLKNNGSGNGRPKSKQQTDSDYFKRRIREELGRTDQPLASPDDPDGDIPF